MKTKICTKCNIEKEISEFYKKARGKFKENETIINNALRYLKGGN